MSEGMIALPEQYWPKNGSHVTFDPVVMRSMAEAYNRHPYDHDIKVSASVVLYLLDVLASTTGDFGAVPEPSPSVLEQRLGEAQALAEQHLSLASDYRDKWHADHARLAVLELRESDRQSRQIVCPNEDCSTDVLAAGAWCPDCGRGTAYRGLGSTSALEVEAIRAVRHEDGIWLHFGANAMISLDSILKHHVAHGQRYGTGPIVERNIREFCDRLASATKPEASPSPENQDFGDEQSSSCGGAS